MRNKAYILLTTFLVAVSGFSFAAPAPAHAQATGAACAIGGYLTSAISGALGGILGGSAASVVAVPANVVGPVQVAESARQQKEFTLDRLASCAAKELLHQMTVSTINWINSGFNGSPAFLSNPQAFFLDAADQVTGFFLADSGPLKNLCSPWSVDIRLALAFGQSNFSTGQRRYSCTLGTIINNAKNPSVSVEGFVQGDFSQGGWPAFMGMVTEPQNNPYGAYLTANSNLMAAIGARKAGLSKALLEGQGFLSWQSCQAITLTDDQESQLDEDGSIATGDGIIRFKTGGGYEICHTETPGSVIAHTLNAHADTGIVETEMANDINSVVNALVTQLTTQMLSKGLHALSSSGSGVSGGIYNSANSYVSQVQNDALAGQIAGTYANAVNLLTASKASYLFAEGCFSAKLPSAALGAGAATSTVLISNSIAAINNALATEVEPLLTSMAAKQTAAQNNSPSVSKASADSDFSLVQGQTAIFNADAAAYEATCESI